MAARTIFVLFLALICGVSTAFGVYRFYVTTSEQAKVVVEQIEMVPVVVSTIDLPLVGSTLREEMLKVQQWPKKFLPAGAVADTETLVGQTIHVPLRKGEVILEGKFGAGRGLASLVDEG